jgi:hypothetical protein
MPLGRRSLLNLPILATEIVDHHLGHTLPLLLGESFAHAPEHAQGVAQRHPKRKDDDLPVSPH